MSNPTIRQRRKTIEDKLRKHDAARKIIEAELLALQHECEQRRGKTWSDGGGYGGPDWLTTYFDCPDCGLHKIA